MRFPVLIPMFAGLTLLAACLPQETVEPETKLLSKPAEFSNVNEPVFEFESDQDSAQNDVKFVCQLDNAPEVDCVSPYKLSGVTEGQHTLLVKAVVNGTEDPTPAECKWTVDLTPPDTTITLAPPAVTGESQVAVQFTSSDAGAKFKCQLDNQAEIDCVSGVKVSVSTNGQHTFTVYAVDKAGNKDPSPAECKFTVDTHGPIVTVTGNIVGDKSGPNVSLKLTADESPVTFKCTLDGVEVACDAGSVSFNGLTDGSQHTFHVRALDALGNAGPDYERTFTVDATGPIVTISGIVAGGTTGSDPTISFTAPADAVTFQCSLDGSLMDCTPGVPVKKSPLADGQHTFTVQATDEFGNQGSDSITFTVDATGPTVSITSPTENQIFAQGTAPSAVFSSTDPQPVTFRCQIDLESQVDCSSPMVLPTSQTGQHHLVVIGHDFYGNTTTAHRTYLVR